MLIPILPMHTNSPIRQKVFAEETGNRFDIEATFSAQPVENNLLLAIFGARLGTGHGATTPSGWTEAYKIQQDYGSATGTLAVYWKQAGASESQTVTVPHTYSYGTTNCGLIIAEIKESNAYNAVDEQVTAYDLSSTTKVIDAGTTGSINPVPAFGLCAGLAGAGSYTGFSWDEDFSNLGSVVNNDGSYNFHLCAAYREFDAITTISPTCTWLGGSNQELFAGCTVWN